MKYFLVIAALLIIILIGSAVYVNSGTYNISAAVPHNSITLWVIENLTDISIQKHAENIKVPNLTKVDMIKTGFAHYREMCEGCHGAPGRKQNEIAEGLYPKPPELVKAVKDWEPAELFWITKNGIKMTGMPSFGKTHSDEKIWDIVAFMETLPEMSKEKYDYYDKSIPQDDED